MAPVPGDASSGPRIIYRRPRRTSATRSRRTRCDARCSQGIEPAPLVSGRGAGGRRTAPQARETAHLAWWQTASRGGRQRGGADRGLRAVRDALPVRPDFRQGREPGRLRRTRPDRPGRTNRRRPDGREHGGGRLVRRGQRRNAFGDLRPGRAPPPGASAAGPAAVAAVRDRREADQPHGGQAVLRAVRLGRTETGIVDAHYGSARPDTARRAPRAKTPDEKRLLALGEVAARSSPAPPRLGSPTWPANWPRSSPCRPRTATPPWSPRWNGASSSSGGAGYIRSIFVAAGAAPIPRSAGGGEHGIERGGELGVPIPDEEPEPGAGLLQVH